MGSLRREDPQLSEAPLHKGCSALRWCFLIWGLTPHFHFLFRNYLKKLLQDFTYCKRMCEKSDFIQLPVGVYLAAWIYLNIRHIVSVNVMSQYAAIGYNSGSFLFICLTSVKDFFSPSYIQIPHRKEWGKNNSLFLRMVWLCYTLRGQCFKHFKWSWHGKSI